MKKKTSKLIIPGLLILVALFITYFLFSWKKYTNSQVGFTFWYPKKLNICEEFYPKLDQYFVHISDRDCSKYEINTDGNIYINISDGKTKTDIKDIKEYLDNDKKAYDSQQEGKLPVTPGYYWGFKEYAGSLFGMAKTSAANIDGIGGDNWYVVIKQDKILQVHSDKGLNLVTRIIFLSIRSN